MISDTELKYAFEKACLARSRAYAPYSKFKVGVAIKIASHDSFVLGCNVENVSYGGTICAERVAISSVVACYEEIDMEYMVLVTDFNEPAFPCGLCLQVIQEFCGPNFPIFICNLQGIQERVLLGDLMPRGFKSFS